MALILMMPFTIPRDMVDYSHITQGSPVSIGFPWFTRL